jgi:ubiquinol-cytochrome c reductase cytochrome c subunit
MAHGRTPGLRRTVRLAGGRIALAALTAAIPVVMVAPAVEAQPQQVEELGGDLFTSKCASCHGAEGGGSDLGPALTNSGAAGADFYLRTGRMPLPFPEAPTQRKPVSLTEEQIEALVAYVGSLGDGPEIPEVDTSEASLSRGAELFAGNCAACHGATANGGAVGGNAFAPSLYSATPVEVAEAMIIGPGEMPVFNFSDADRNSLVSYVGYLQNQEDPGGLDIGGIGPVSEGYVAWALAMVLLVVIILVIGRSKAGGDES